MPFATFTATGTRLCVEELLPNRPEPLFPQLYTIPSDANARLWLAPAATAVTVLPTSTPLVVTATGTRLVDIELLPNWPLPLLPQA